jgi:hypothetical protein
MLQCDDNITATNIRLRIENVKNKLPGTLQFDIRMQYFRDTSP